MADETYDDILPNPGFEIDKSNTALVITDPQRDFLSEDGVVWAVVGPSVEANNNLLVEFVDNGPGIPQDIQSRVFDPFFTTKDVGQGVGLGLDVSRRIITERCGGQISLTSEPGNTRFQIRLPIARE